MQRGSAERRLAVAEEHERDLDDAEDHHMTVTTISQIPTASCRDGISRPSPIGMITTRNTAQQIASTVAITVSLVVVTSSTEHTRPLKPNAL
jgi:hypothetical protein